MDNLGTVESCTCRICKRMCMVPCMGTFEEIKAIAEAGFADRLMLYFQTMGAIPLLLPAHKEYERKKVELRAPTPCTFQNEQGLCELHNLGLKPTEGRIVLHKQRYPNLTRYNLAQTWNNLGARKFIMTWIQEQHVTISQEIERIILNERHSC